MKIDDIYESDRHEYNSICSSCGKKHSLLTQEDNSPEYHTSIFILCDCGNYIIFNLPVN